MDKPEWYYKQSAVIPFQKKGDEIHIVVLASLYLSHQNCGRLPEEHLFEDRVLGSPLDYSQEL